jgi:hypothetical protein
MERVLTMNSSSEPHKLPTNKVGQRYKWLFIVVLLSFVGLIGYLVLDAITLGKCKVQITKAKQSPSQQHILLQYERLCGLGGGASTNLAFVSSPYQYYFPSFLEPILTVKGRVNIIFQWVQESEIEVQVPKELGVIKRIDSFDGISIHFVTD